MVQDNSTPPDQPGESRKAKRARIRNRYESSDLSLKELAKLEGLKPTTLEYWSFTDKWVQRRKLVTQAVKKAEADAAGKIAKHLQDQLAPLIEQAKVHITKRGIKLGNRGLSRIEKLWREKPPDAAQTEAYGAKAAETFLRMVRVSAGMGDGSPAAGPVNVNILTNRAAVQMVGPDSQD